MKGLSLKKKIWISIPLVVILIAIIWYVSSTQWTRDFDLKYVEYVSDWKTGNSYRIYEITNNTDRTFKNVSVVILVEDLMDEFKYEDFVVSRIRPGETVEYRLYEKDYEKAAEEQGEILVCVTAVEIVKIKYSR